jgi:FtsP/CotA-like multicopper oxidase with cupredoxin domain
VSTTTRLIAVAATVAVLVIAFLVLSPGDEEPATTTPVATAPAPPPASTTTATTAPAPPAAPKPKFTAIVVRNGKPVGGVKRIEVAKGDRARIEVSSTDTADHVHVHGYDLMRDLAAGGRARFSFTANAEGIFEIELEDAGVEIAKLVVQPG